VVDFHDRAGVSASWIHDRDRDYCCPRAASTLAFYPYDDTLTITRMVRLHVRIQRQLHVSTRVHTTGWRLQLPHVVAVIDR